MTMATDSLFTRIIKGELPSHKVYEDELTYAFMDIHPIQPGQVLVVPRRQVAYVWDLDDREYAALMLTVKKVAGRIRQVFPHKKLAGVHIEGLDVPHAHVKVFPFDTDQEFHNRPSPTAPPDHDELAVLAERIRF